MPINRFAETYPVYANITMGPGNGTNAVQSSPGVGAPHRWDVVIAHSTAAADHDVLLDAYVGSVQFKLGTVKVPAGAGLTTVPAKEMLSALLATPNDGIVLPASSLLRATCAVTLAAGETLIIAMIGGTV